MRRFALLLIIVALTFSAASLAQEYELLWELNLDNYVDIEDLGFRFYYPIGWDYDASDGIIFAENGTEGVTISVSSVPLAEIGDLTLDESVQFAIESAEITEIDRGEFPVLARRAMTILGQDSAERYVLLTLWQQYESLVITQVNIPDAETINDVAYSWGALTALFEPLNALELSEDIITLSEAGITMPYPADWFVAGDGSVVYELEEDIEKAPPSGLVISVNDKSLEDEGLEDDATVEDLAAANLESYGLSEPIESSEMLILGQPALMLKAEDAYGMGQWTLLTQVILDGRGVTIQVIGASEQSLDDFESTLVRMLQTIALLES